jgi:hypothetical protein
MPCVGKNLCPDESFLKQGVDEAAIRRKSLYLEQHRNNWNSPGPGGPTSKLVAHMPILHLSIRVPTGFRDLVCYFSWLARGSSRG